MREQSLLTQAYRHAKTNAVISRGIKRIWELKLGEPSSERIIQHVDLKLKALGIFYRKNETAVEQIADSNGHRQKVVGERESIIWGVAQTKGKGRKCEIAKMMFLHSDLLKFCLKKNTTSLSSFLTQLYFTIIKPALQGNGVKIYIAINQSNNNIYKFNLRQTLPKYLRIFLNEFEVLTILANRPIILQYQA